jgi:uncharacterized protein (TIGR03437 family)
MFRSSVSTDSHIKMKSSRALLLWAGLAAVCASGQTPTQTPVFTTGQAARLVLGQVNFTIGNYGTTSSLLGSPAGLAYANGVLWVADANRLGGTPDNNRVLRFSDTATYPSPTQDPTIPGNTCGVCRGQASLVLGQPDFISSNPAINATGMRNPTGIATAEINGNTVVVVSDTDNNRVLVWLSYPTANGQPADVVIGQPDFAHYGTSSPPTAQSLRGPAGVWIDGNGKLYVADTEDNRILIYNKIPTKNNAAADVVIGAPNFTTPVSLDLTTNNILASATNMQTPTSVTTDGTRMYVADLAQNRVLIWNTIPTTNGAPADVALGQLNLTTGISNNSYSVAANAPLDCDGIPTSGVTPVMCESNAAYAASIGQTGSKAVDSDGNTLYPVRCAATMSLPRYAFSDGTHLYVADGGNDRIMIYNTIPKESGTPADTILGEPDEFSDNTGQNPDGADALQTPTSMAFDGLNLYVSDLYNRRVVVYTPGVLSIPLGGQGTLNAASLNIYAIGSVQLGGTINAKDTVTITINGKAYTYTIISTDTLATVANALVKLIDTAPDPNVIASANDTTDVVILTARTPGSPGASVTLAATVSSGAQITAEASGNTLNLYLQDPTSIAPGTLIEVNSNSAIDATLCTNTASADLTQPYLPFTLAGCELFADGNQLPLLYVSPTQINAQMPYYFTDRSSTSLYFRQTNADGSITVSSPVAVTIVPENPGIFAGYGSDPRPGYVFHGSSYATSVILVDGSINAGDVGAITIGGNTYTYTVKATDTLESVTDAFANLINSKPDPNVTAGAANQFASLILVARQPGAAGEGIAVSETVTGTNTVLSLTVNNPTTCCNNVEGELVTQDNPAIPGEVVYVMATGLGPPNPSNIDTGAITPGGQMNPPATPVDSILTDGSSANILSAALIPGLVGVYYVQFQIGPAATTDLKAQLTIAQTQYVSNVVVFAIVAPPTTSTSAKRAVRKKPAH